MSLKEQFEVRDYMKKTKIKKIISETIKRLPDKYKIKLLNIKKEKQMFKIFLLFPKKIKCSITIISGKFDRLTDKQFIGLIAHEIAHYWSRSIPAKYRKIMTAVRLYLLENAFKDRGELKKAEQIKKEYLKIINPQKYPKNRRGVERVSKSRK